MSRWNQSRRPRTQLSPARSALEVCDSAGVLKPITLLDIHREEIDFGWTYLRHAPHGRFCAGNRIGHR